MESQNGSPSGGPLYEKLLQTEEILVELIGNKSQRGLISLDMDYEQLVKNGYTLKITLPLNGEMFRTLLSVFPNGVYLVTYQEDWMEIEMKLSQFSSKLINKQINKTKVIRSVVRSKTKKRDGSETKADVQNIKNDATELCKDQIRLLKLPDKTTIDPSLAQQQPLQQQGKSVIFFQQNKLDSQENCLGSTKVSQQNDDVVAQTCKTKHAMESKIQFLEAKIIYLESKLESLESKVTELLKPRILTENKSTQCSESSTECIPVSTPNLLALWHSICAAMPATLPIDTHKQDAKHRSESTDENELLLEITSESKMKMVNEIGTVVQNTSSTPGIHPVESCAMFTWTPTGWNRDFLYVPPKPMPGKSEPDKVQSEAEKLITLPKKLTPVLNSITLASEGNTSESTIENELRLENTGESKTKMVHEIGAVKEEKTSSIPDFHPVKPYATFTLTPTGWDKDIHCSSPKPMPGKPEPHKVQSVAEKPITSPKKLTSVSIPITLASEGNTSESTIENELRLENTGESKMKMVHEIGSVNVENTSAIPGFDPVKPYATFTWTPTGWDKDIHYISPKSIYGTSEPEKVHSVAEKQISTAEVTTAPHHLPPPEHSLSSLQYPAQKVETRPNLNFPEESDANVSVIPISIDSTQSMKPERSILSKVMERINSRKSKSAPKPAKFIDAGKILRQGGIISKCVVQDGCNIRHEYTGEKFPNMIMVKMYRRTKNLTTNADRKYKEYEGPAMDRIIEYLSSIPESKLKVDIGPGPDYMRFKNLMEQKKQKENKLD